MTNFLTLPTRYPGLYWTAKFIGPYFPMSKYYVEPFAGLARTANHSRSKIMVLNDKSQISNNYCRKKFRDAIIENMDFEETMKKYDSPETFFLIDPPWRIDFYNGNKEIRSSHGKPIKHRNPNAVTGGYIDRSALQYIKKLKEILPKLKGDWILTLGPSHHLSFKKYFSLQVQSFKPRLFGFHSKTWLFSNKPLKVQITQITDF